MIRTPHLVFAAAGLIAITVAGTLGYIAIEGATLREALYMTVLTLSTVGFREIIPLSPAGQYFTIGLIVFGVGTALYLLSVMAQGILAGGSAKSYGEAACNERSTDSMST